MRNFVIGILLLCMAGVSGHAAAQSLFPDPTFYDSRVSLIDEFMKRFNRENQAADSCEQLRQVVNLFNISNFKSETDSLYLQAVAFANDVVNSNCHITYTDSLWHAEAFCSGLYKNKPVDFTLRLVVEPFGKDMYRWAVNGAYGDVFALTPSATGTGFMVLPDDHETNFMSLTDMTASQVDCVKNYAAANVKIDPLSVFFTMVYDGQLKIKHVKSIDFVFNQIPGWSFTVRKIERDSSNSGWLIDSLTKL